MAVVLAGALLGEVAAAEAPIRVGDPAHPDSLPAALVAGYRAGVRDFTLVPGTGALLICEIGVICGFL